MMRKSKAYGLFIVFMVVMINFAYAYADVIPQTNWSLRYVDSQELVGENGAALNAFDGNSNTIWHTQWVGSNPPCPHEIQIDLGLMYDIDGFRYLPRQDGGANGRIGQYEFYVSTDGINWGSPVATGTFANSSIAKEVFFTPKTGRFIHLRALTEVNGNPWTSMAEINVLGILSGGNQAPNGVIDSPSGNVVINVGDWVSFAGTGSDPDGNLPLSFRWQFGAGSGIPDSTLEDPGLVQFNTPGTFTVTFTVTDVLGLYDLTPATRTVSVQSNSSAAHMITYWPDNKAGAVSLTFDDGLLSQYSLAVPALNARGFKGTFFIITHAVGDPYATWDDWKDTANIGHEIGSHTKTHPYLTTLSPPQMEDEIAGSKTEIDAQITSQKCLTFAYPFGDLDDNVELMAQGYYIAARGISGISCNLNSEPFDFYNVIACDDDRTLEEIKAQTDAAEQQGRWLVTYFHYLDGTGFGHWRIDTLTDYLDYLMTKDLWVGTFGSVVKYIKERASADLSVVSSSSDQILLSLTDTMDDATFDEPLTIRSEVPSNWVTVSVEQGSSITMVESAMEGTTTVIYYNAVPDRGLISLEGNP